jgi:aspartyl-tRNA(Asn)/glutamyl-tRNA(Gln) amidotransferase subunit C
MTDVTRAEIERMANLARLDIDDETLSGLVPQIRRILEFVSRLDAIDADGDRLEHPWLSERTILPLRRDEVRPPVLHGQLHDVAPAFREGFFVVPRLEAMDDE